MRHVVMFSGGLGSWMTARRVREVYGTDDLVLLFADVGSDRSPHVGEDEDTYRFVREAALDVLGPLRMDAGGFVTVRDGRDIWQVFRDDRFLGKARTEIHQSSHGCLPTLDGIATHGVPEPVGAVVDDEPTWTGLVREVADVVPLRKGRAK